MTRASESESETEREGEGERVGVFEKMAATNSVGLSNSNSNKLTCNSPSEHNWLTELN